MSGFKGTPGPWGIEQTSSMLWVGPMRPDGNKVDTVVVGLNIDRELTVTAALRQHWNANLIAVAPCQHSALNYVADMTYCDANGNWCLKEGYDPQVVLDVLGRALGWGELGEGERP